MPSDAVTAPTPRRAQAATRLIFFIAGLAMAAWAPLVPLAQRRAGLDEAQLGAMLLFLGIGSLLAMPLSGLLVARHGCRRVLVAATLLVAVALPALAWLAQPLALAAALLLFGVGMGALDCAANLQAVKVERDSGRPMMSGFHGLWSVGGIAGAGGVSTLLAVGLIYAVFYLMKNNPRLMNVLGILGTTGLQPGKKSPAIQIESSLGLEARKNLYILRCDTERFLVATSPDGTQFLSRLSDAPEIIGAENSPYSAEINNLQSQSSGSQNSAQSDISGMSAFPPVSSASLSWPLPEPAIPSSVSGMLKSRFQMPRLLRQLMSAMEGR